MQQARRQGSRLRPPNAPPASCKHACVSWSTRPVLEEGPAPGANRADGRNWPQRDAAHARPSHGKHLTMRGTASEPNSGACLQRERQPNMLDPAARKSCLGPSRASLGPRFAAATLQPACEPRSDGRIQTSGLDVRVASKIGHELICQPKNFTKLSLRWAVLTYSTYVQIVHTQMCPGERV